MDRSPRKSESQDEGKSGFRRQLGLFDSTMLVVGTMIGSGIFVVSASMSRELASPGWLMVAWILTGAITIIGALCYAELAAMMPHAGGQYVYLREAFSPLWGYLYGWTVFLVIQTGSIAAVSVVFAKYLGVLVPQLGIDPLAGAVVIYQNTFAEPLIVSLPLPWLQEPLTIFKRSEFVITRGNLVGVAVTMFLAWVNCVGVRAGTRVQNIFAIAKTVGLLLLIVVGLTLAANPDALKANTTEMWGGGTTTKAFSDAKSMFGFADSVILAMVFGGALVGSLFSADAWNNVTFTAGEMKNPRRNLALSLTLGTVIVICLYLLVNLGFMASLPVRGDVVAAQELVAAGDNQGAIFAGGISGAQDDRVGAAVMARAWPSFGPQLIAVFVMISTFGCVNGMTLMGARLYYAMAQDGLFFKSVGKLNSKGVPAVGLILQGLFACLLIFSGTYNELLDYVIFACLLFYSLTVIGLFVLRARQPDAERPYRVIGYPILPAVYVILCLVIMVDLLLVKPEFTWPGLIIVLAGIPVYYVWRLVGGAKYTLK